MPLKPETFVCCRSLPKFTENRFSQLLSQFLRIPHFGLKPNDEITTGNAPELACLVRGMQAHICLSLLNKYEAMIDELKDQADSIREELKSHMLALDTEELFAGTYVIRYTPVTSNRFDTASFKKLHGELYKAYVKSVCSRRFSIN